MKMDFLKSSGNFHYDWGSPAAHKTPYWVRDLRWIGPLHAIIFQTQNVFIHDCSWDDIGVVSHCLPQHSLCLRFTITLKLEILNHLYLKELISKSVFKNDVFVKINLTKLQMSFLLICVSHNCVHSSIALPHPTLNLILNLKNSLNYIFH